MFVFSRAVSLRSSGASSSSALLLLRSQARFSSTQTTTSNTTTTAAAGGAGGGDENVFSSPDDARFASKIAHTLRRKVFAPDFQPAEGQQLDPKEAELLRMWRELGNNPALANAQGATASAAAAAGEEEEGAALLRQLQEKELGAMNTQTTAWEGSGAMAAAQEAAEMQLRKASGGGGDAGDEAADGDYPVNVAEAYGQSFQDTRPSDPNEPLDAKRRRLLYQSRYRGMVEMDLIFGHFARCRLADLDAPLLEEYNVLLKQLDNDLFRWLVMDLERPAEIEKMQCFHELRKFVKEQRTELLGNI